jgi:PIN domain nuclease of toxin-antitoxin system
VRLLLDTHVLLWTLLAPEEVWPEARELIEDGAQDILVSAASAWEIAIKRAQGRLEAPQDLAAAVAKQSFRPLPIRFEHAAAAGDLPRHHRDPFDRMLIAQAMVEGLTIMTRDTSFEAYGVPLLRA